MGHSLIVPDVFGVCWRRAISDPLSSWLEPQLLEANTEDLVDHAPTVDELERTRKGRAVALHGVSLSLGSVDPLSGEYLDALASLERRLKPQIVSDHLCWSSYGGRYTHDLLPLPMTRDTLDHLTGRVDGVQQRLGRAFAIENISRYVAFTADIMPEWELLAELAHRTNCEILLDLNNLYVNEVNLGESPRAWLTGLRSTKVVEFHLAGGRRVGKYIIDSHDQPVSPPVWQLYREASQLFPSAVTVVEWDGKLADLQPLRDAITQAKAERYSVR